MNYSIIINSIFCIIIIKMAEFIRRLRNIFTKLSANYDKRVLSELSIPLKHWRSKISDSETNKSNYIEPNTPNGKQETKQKNGIQKSKSTDKINSKSMFNNENYCCLICRYRSENLRKYAYHISNKHKEEDREWLQQKRCVDCKITFYKSFQYQQHYIGCHDTRTDEEVQATIEDFKIKKGVISEKPPKKDLPKGNFCDV